MAPASSPLPAAAERHQALVTDALVFDLTAVPCLTFRKPSSSPLARLVAHVLLRVWLFGLMPAPAQHAMVTVWPLAFVLAQISRPLVVPTAEPASEEGVVPDDLPQTPSSGAAVGGGSGHGARSRRERAIALGEGQAAAALSRDKRKGDFGIGWRLDVSSVELQEMSTAGLDWQGTSSGGFFPTYCLQATRPHVVTLTLPGGEVGEFDMALSPSCQPFVPPQAVQVSFTARPGTHGTLVPVGDAEAFLVGSWPGAQELYSGVDFGLYDPDLYEYTTPDGRRFLVHQTGGLRRMADPSGNTLTIGPGGIAHSSGKSVAFTRDAQGRITVITDPAGAELLYGTDAAGDLVAVTDRDGHTTTFTYEPAIPHHLREIRDPLGRTPIRNEYYPDGRIKSHTDAFGKTIEYAHDLVGRQELVTDRNGQLRVLHYDARGNVTREIGPDGAYVDRTFDLRNNRLTETDPYDPATTPSPRTTVSTYDAADNLTSLTNPQGERTEYTYNARRQVLTTRDPRGKVTENVYDAKGNLTSTRDALGHVTTYVYDTRGNLTSQSVTVDGVVQTTSYAYDPAGNVVSETDATGHVTTYTYDTGGNRLTQTTTRTLPDASVQTLVTQYEYDASGRLTKTTDPDGTFTRTVYDPMGRPKETYDKLGRQTELTYDEMGRLVRTTYPNLTFEDSTYDHEGRRLTAKDRAGRLTRYEYDPTGRLRKTIFPDLTFTENVYDPAGRLTQTIDARLQSTFFAYDDAGRRTSVRDPLGHETSFGYDPNGNQTSMTDPKGETTTFVYDDLNRRTRTILPDETFTETTYDELGRRTSERDQAGKVTQFRYDALGRLTSVIDARLAETTYGYDELGNRASQTDANGHTTRFEYDGLGRETARVLPGGARETKTYWPTGALKTRTDFMDRTTTYDYDANDRLIARLAPSMPVVGFTYTTSGRRETMTDSRGTTTYAYDTRDRLRTLTYPDGRRLEYEWDPSGNRTLLRAVVDGQTLDTIYSYDAASRLDVVTDPAGRTYDHGYDLNGNRQSLGYPNGVTTGYTYDTLNRLRTLTTAGPLGLVQSYTFTLGPAGNRQHIDEAGGVRRSYTYDDLYRLTGEQVTVNGIADYEKVFAYDDVGNRGTQTTTGSGAPGTPTAPASVTYAYDERDRLILKGSQTHTWDGNGNLTAKVGDATYAWDTENRLVRVEKADGTVVEHAYDADGARVQTTVIPVAGPPVVTNFLVDTSGSLSHVVAETAATGTLTAVYVRGDDLLSVLRPDTSAPNGWQTRFFHPDGIGSIRRLTDEAGAVTDAYTYTAFGERISHTGSDVQPYAFAGEPYDPNSGFQYHRARWMDPASGRFATVDPWLGAPSDPPSLHRYLYAEANPVTSVDPSGLAEFSLSGTLTTLSNLTSLAARAAGPALRSLQPVMRFFWNNRNFNAVSKAYWAKYGPAAGRSLHHWFFPNSAKWIPQGLRNAGFNLVELPHLLPGRLGLNQWMGFAARWGGYRAVLAGFIENGIRWGIPLALYAAEEIGAAAGTAIHEFTLDDLERELEDDPNSNLLDP